MLRREQGKLPVVGCDDRSRLPVEWAADHGLVEGSPVDRSWCLSHQMDTVMGLEPISAVAPELLLWQQGALSVSTPPGTGSIPRPE